MGKLRDILYYLAHLERTEVKQHICLFCDHKNFENILYEDEKIIAIKNRRAAGEHHWLLMPSSSSIRHIRDIEALEGDDLALLRKLNEVKETLLSQYCSDIPSAAVHSGYHRGRRPLMGNIYYPDIVSIHHLHLHIIVQPRPFLKFFKYPPWLPLMWKSDKTVMREIQTMKERRD